MVDLKKTLKEKGLKPTPHRIQILSLFYQSQEPLSAEEIFKHCQGYRRLNLSTVYRTLETLKSGGIIRSLNFEGEDRTLYELKQRHTHYLKCLGCKKILPVDFCPLGDMDTISKSQNFQITEHRLDMYGYCQDCKDQSAHS
ncbi:MAG TPA: Fur family transcriptional regulator [Clostridia bacterium]|jgi:Fur family ferric uptake transcriptional regulator